MATIEKRERAKGTVYRAVVRLKGYPAQRKTFRRLTDAREWVEQVQGTIRRGEFQNVVKTAATRTLRDVIERYRVEALPHKSAGAQRADKAALDFWERELGGFALSYIDEEAITARLNTLRREGYVRRRKEGSDGDAPKPIARSLRTIKHYRDVLSLLFKHARTWRWTGSNPVDHIPPITKLRNERTRYLSDEERRSLIDAARKSENEQLYPIVVFALSTGARRGEILGLTVSDVDLKRGVAVLRNTKNGETRAVPVVHHLRDLLKEQAKKVMEAYEALPVKPRQQWLFARRDGLAPIDIRKAWESARDEAGLTDFRFHDLRHSAASYLAMNGASQVEIAEVLGHRTLQMVRRYAHLSESHVKSLVERVNEKMFEPFAN